MTKSFGRSEAVLRFDIIKAISKPEDENLPGEIRLLLEYYTPFSGKMDTLKDILGSVNLEELNR